MLLALNEKSGGLWPVPCSVLDRGAAAAVMMDLMAFRRIDCDINKVFVVNSEPTDDENLDLVLNVLTFDPVRTTRAITDEIRFLSDEGEALRERALERLAERGILDSEERKVLWVFGSRRYSVIRNDEIREVKGRILDVIQSDDIPDPRDAALVSLVKACGLFPHLLKPHQLALGESRIADVARMDVLGCALGEAMFEVEASIAMASGLR